MDDFLKWLSRSALYVLAATLAVAVTDKVYYDNK